MRKLSELDYFDLLLLNGHNGKLYPSIEGTTHVCFDGAEAFSFDDQVTLLRPGREVADAYAVRWVREEPLQCYVEINVLRDSYLVILAVQPFTKKTGTDVILLKVGSLNEVLER